jgi:hypothetical protein
VEERQEVGEEEEAVPVSEADLAAARWLEQQQQWQLVDLKQKEKEAAEAKRVRGAQRVVDEKIAEEWICAHEKRMEEEKQAEEKRVEEQIKWEMEIDNRRLAEERRVAEEVRKAALTLTPEEARREALSPEERLAEDEVIEEARRDTLTPEQRLAKDQHRHWKEKDKEEMYLMVATIKQREIDKQAKIDKQILAEKQVIADRAKAREVREKNERLKAEKDKKEAEEKAEKDKEEAKEYLQILKDEKKKKEQRKKEAERVAELEETEKKEMREELFARYEIVAPDSLLVPRPTCQSLTHFRTRRPRGRGRRKLSLGWFWS